MSPKDFAQWLVIAAMLVSGGIWLGKLQQQVTDGAKQFQYVNGTITVPTEAK